MEASFWHNKWEINQIGFHRDSVNPLIEKHHKKFQLAKGSRIFLPLCGKTLDIAYLLKQGFQVVGIELSEIAIDALFEELGLSPEITTIDKLKRYKAENIEIFAGDFFELSTEILGTVDATYDRAALIALPAETRQRYSKHLTEITQTAQQLIICLDYDQDIMSGPPFSVTPAELEQHYAAHYKLANMESNYSEDGLKGKFPLTESVWLLQA